MENQPLNGTFQSCKEPLEYLHIVVNSILLFVSFPATFIIIVRLLSRVCRQRSLSSAEIFLLQINLANVCLSIFNLLLFLEAVHVSNFSSIYLIVFFSPTLTARPVFLLAMCVIFYLAIVHPVTYMALRTRPHWEWIVVALGWLYALVVNIAAMAHTIDMFEVVFPVVFYNTILPSMFFNIATLRALYYSTPGGNRQAMNPAKRKAFRIILGILVLLLLYYVPRVCYTSYPYIAPGDWERFECAEGSVMMLLPKVSEFSMPVIFLYSLQKLGVGTQADT